MEYKFIHIEDSTNFQLVTDTLIIGLDSLNPIHAKMIEDFKDPANIEKFVTLLQEDPATAFEIYNQSI
jgi:hypothetical protein